MIEFFHSIYGYNKDHHHHRHCQHHFDDNNMSTTSKYYLSAVHVVWVPLQNTVRTWNILLHNFIFDYILNLLGMKI